MDNRNIRGRLKQCLSELDSASQKALAVRFVRHAAKLLSECDRDQILECLDVLDGFLNGIGDVRTTNDRVQGFIEGEWTSTQHNGSRASYSLSQIGDVMRLLLLCCCKQELEAAGLMKRSTRYQPSAFTVGLEAAKGFAASPSAIDREIHWQLAAVESEAKIVQNKAVNRSTQSRGN